MGLFKRKTEKLKTKQNELEIQADQIVWIKGKETKDRVTKDKFRIQLTDAQANYINQQAGDLSGKTKDIAFSKIWNGYAPGDAYVYDGWKKIGDKESAINYIKSQFGINNYGYGNEIFVDDAYLVFHNALKVQKGIKWSVEADKIVNALFDRAKEEFHHQQELNEKEMKAIEISEQEKKQKEADAIKEFKPEELNLKELNEYVKDLKYNLQFTYDKEKTSARKTQLEKCNNILKQNEADAIAIYSNYMTKQDSWTQGEQGEAFDIAKQWYTWPFTKTISNKLCTVEQTEMTSSYMDDNDKWHTRKDYSVKIKISGKTIYSGEKKFIEQKSLDYQKQKEASKQALALTIPAPIEADSETLK